MLRRKKRTTGKISLTILFSGLVVFTVMMTAVTQLASGYRDEQQLLYETTLELNQTTATKMAVTMDTLLRSMKSTLTYGSAVVSEHWEDTEALQERLDLLRQGGGEVFNSIFLADGDGRVRKISPLNTGLEGRLLDSPASMEALRLQAPLISEPYIGATGRLIVLMSMPVTDNSGNYLGFLGGTVYLQETNVFYDMFGAHEESGSGTYTYIVSERGNLVFHPDTTRLGDPVVANPVVQELVKGRDGAMLVTNTAGVEFLAGYHHVAGNGWGIVSQTPLATVKASIAEHTWHRFISAVPFALLMVVVAVFLARRLAEPFVVLSDIARKISEGERVSESLLDGHWYREADSLGKSMQIAMRFMQLNTDRLTNEAMTDALTGLPNRRAMNEALEGISAAGRPFALLILDIDRFKSINDTHGHAASDEVLRFLADTVRSETEPNETCYRYGGEEFVVVMDGVDTETAYPAAERIRRRFERTPSPIGPPITVSIGVADCPGSGKSAERVFQAADEALYRAKQGGRNRTIKAIEAEVFS